MIADTIAACAAALFTGVGVWVAWVQLSGIKRSMDMSALMALLAIETEMNQRKRDFDSCSTKIQQAKLSDQMDEQFRALKSEFNCAKENYLNVLDRLASCVLRGYLNDELRTDYRGILENVIKKFPDDFNEASQFRSIKKLNAKWQDE